MNAHYLLSMLRVATPTVLMAEASNNEIQELQKELFRWYVLAARETDLRVRQGQKETTNA